MFQLTDELFDTLYQRNYVTLGYERFGGVCLATRKSDGRKVAVKSILRYYYGTSTYIMAGYLEHLMNEVAMMTLMKQPPISPYVIQMLEWFHSSSETFIVMEDPGYCTVLEKIVAHHQLDEKVARVIMRQAVQAAQHCISHGVFHFQITADNILINTSTLDIKLIDFGYSLPYTGRKYHRLIGEDYLTPEFDYSAIKINVWQLGDLLRHMVYGPYDPSIPFRLSDPRARARTRVFISNECASLIDWCTCVDNTKRPTLEQILKHRWFQQE